MPMTFLQIREIGLTAIWFRYSGTKKKKKTPYLYPLLYYLGFLLRFSIALRDTVVPICIYVYIFIYSGRRWYFKPTRNYTHEFAGCEGGNGGWSCPSLIGGNYSESNNFLNRHILNGRFSREKPRQFRVSITSNNILL